MSWSTSTSVGMAKDAVEVDAPVLSDAVEVEQGEQFAAALAAAKLLLAAVGRPGDKVVVLLNGHANPGHAPRPGWDDEQIVITVRAIPEK